MECVLCVIVPLILQFAPYAFCVCAYLMRDAGILIRVFISLLYIAIKLLRHSLFPESHRHITIYLPSLRSNKYNYTFRQWRFSFLTSFLQHFSPVVIHNSGMV